MSEAGRARCLIAGALVCALSWPVWGADNYEPNNSALAAYDLSAYAGTALSSIDGLADTDSSDDDWYVIDVTSGYENVVISCSFVHASGDIDIDLYDEYLTLAAYSDSLTNDEQIDTILPPGGGIYYIYVYSSDASANDYDLTWEELLPADDTYEENDTLATAYDLSADEDTWLSTIDGWAVASNVDEDWFEIYVAPGSERVIIDCTYVYAYGDIDIELYDDTGVMLDEAFTMTNDERIDCVVGQAGVYYVLVYEFATSGNLYDLRWSTATPPDDSTTTIICGRASDSSGLGAAVVALMLVGGAAVLRRRRAAEAA